MDKNSAAAPRGVPQAVATGAPVSRTRLIAWAFIVPILLLHFVVKISPSVSAVYYSMTEWSGIGPAEFISIWTFMVFDFVWLLTRGGPAGSSEVLNTLVMKHAFLRFDAGYATAIGLLLSLISSVFIVVFVILRRRGWEI